MLCRALGAVSDSRGVISKALGPVFLTCIIRKRGRPLCGTYGSS
jgi:hypothetical protein